jgi:anaerobic magnesium-protoporphyrin IX monomethyl ester cyclase
MSVLNNNIANQKKAKPLDVLFVNLPSYTPEPANAKSETFGENVVPPLGLLYLANSIKDCSFISSYKCADFGTAKLNGYTGKKHLVELVNKKLQETVINKPDVVAVSLMFSLSYPFFQIIIEEIRKSWKDTVIIVGGVHATNSAEHLLKNNSVDYITCGEGEEAFPALLEVIATGVEKNILGVHSLGNIKKTADNIFEKTKAVEDFNIDYTQYSNLIDMELYTKKTALFSLSKTDVSSRAFTIMASRGCPYLCTYCAAHTVQGRGSRWRDFKNVIDEIYWLNKNYGTIKYYLIDDVFVPKSKTLELFDLLGKVDIEGFEIVILNMSINATDTKIIDAIASIGINTLTFAIESGSKVTQDNIKKWVNLDRAEELCRYSQSKNLNVRAMYVVGFPGETISDMEETFQYAKKLRANWSTFSVASPIPGSEMADQFVELGYIEHGPSSWAGDTLRDRVFDTPEICKEDIKDLAYRETLKANFINNFDLDRSDFKNAETIMTNFIKSYNFHIFAYDCLRRVYKASGNFEKESETIQTMKVLMGSNVKSREFRKYFDLLDDEILSHLNGILEEA